MRRQSFAVRPDGVPGFGGRASSNSTRKAVMKKALPIIVTLVGFTSVCWAQSPSRATSGAAQDSTAIRPFTVPTVPETALDDLRRRIAATRWPEKETVTDASQALQLATI